MSGVIRHSMVNWPVADVATRIATHDAVVCVASLLAGDRELTRALTVLAPAERVRHGTYTNAIVARRFAIGRSTVREVVGCALGLAPDRVPLVEGLHGKPAIARGGSSRPLWFSVAHCEDLLLVALSRTAEVGVDLERARSIEQWERVADRVLDPTERALLRGAVDAGEDPGTVFLRQWCRVEAELKAIGCGIAGLEQHRAGGRPAGLMLADLGMLTSPRQPAASGARYLAALALCSPGAAVERQIAPAASHAPMPTARPARASTA